MALWPFRRKSRRKRSRVSTTDLDDSRGRATETPSNPRRQTLPATMASGTPTEEGTRKARQSPNKLQRRPRAYSFSPGRDDSIKVGRKESTKRKRDVRSKQPATSTPTAAFDGAKMDMTGVGGSKEYVFDRVPTLHNKRDGDHLPRKKSSKKRRKNPEREAEIKAMSSFVPLRPATDDWTAGRPLKKDSRRVKTGFSLGFRGSNRQEWDKENRSSDISIPVAESIHSSMSSDSDHIAYKVSALDALAPRPTLRYTMNPGYPGSGDAALVPVRRSSQRQRMLSMPIPEATLKAHKRIDDLADDLSASDLRELMERDQRRRARKREREAERLEQRLARRAEKEKAQDADARRDGKESPPNLERGVLGRESIGLGIDPTSAVVTSSRRRQPDRSSKRWSQQPEGDEGVSPRDEPRTDPLMAFHRTTSIPLSPIEQQEVDEPVPPLKSPKSRSSFLRPKFSRSKSPGGSEATKTEPSESLKKGSETSSSRGPLSWTSIFKWGLRNKRSSEGPSSFSNTSRDSMQTAQVPPPISATTHFVPRKVSSGVPKRTMSRFREDLPELPISPPDSRMQSPEADAIPHTIDEACPDPDHEMTFTVPARQDRDNITPTSEQRSMEAMRHTPSTFGYPDEPAAPSPELQSMSLASIDSEASWLSGRISRKRVSSNLAPAPVLRRTPELHHEDSLEYDGGNDDVSITNDEYLSRMTQERKRQSMGGEGRPSSDGEGEASVAHWGAIRGHHPTLVHSQTVGRIKSREGLLNSFGEEAETEVQRGGEDDEAATSPTSSTATEEEGGGIQRATSINLGKGHARHISAGSARLLDISPARSRSSAEVTRRSTPPEQR